MTAPHTIWLRRLSDYHSGGVPDAERVAVETHLRDCSECQEALAMYHRFYALASSPLRLGPPRNALDNDRSLYDVPTRPVSAPVSSPGWSSPGGPPPRLPHPPRPRRRALAGIAAGLAAALIVAGFLFALSARSGASIATTPSPKPAATTSANATPGGTVAPTASPSGSTTAPSGFVCANPAGSSFVYAYQNSSGTIFTVTGCSAPKLLYAGEGPASPVAWSPSNRYLAVAIQPGIGNGATNVPLDTIFIFDTHGTDPIITKYSLDYSSGASAGQTARIFLGWLDDSSFLGAVVPLVSGQSGPATGPASIVRVDVASQRETKLATVTWFADTKVRVGGKYLFYGGYQSASEGQGYLHRLDLTTGQDTKLVPLGFAGQAGCQGTPICNWTAQWDVKADGTEVIYHIPGPTKPWSDTYTPPDSPLYLDNLGGASPVQPIVSQRADGLTEPVFSPNGEYIATARSSYDTANQFNHPQTGVAAIGSPLRIVDGSFIAWRADSQAVVLDSSPGPFLYDLATGKTTPLQSSTNVYLWGN